MIPWVFWKSEGRQLMWSRDIDIASSARLTMTPQRSDLVLTSDIPHGERDVLVLDSLHVETWSPSTWPGTALAMEGDGTHQL